MPAPPAPPFLTADLPGIGGRIKVHPEDFEVEEIPAYEPSGQGEHLFLWIEKRDIAPEFFLKTVARKLNIPPGELGAAGMKDRRAITRQWVSAPVRVEPALSQLDGEGLRLLDVKRHDNKLKPGHLRGNRFRILIRDPFPGRRVEGERIIERLREQGMPNFYGPQRFGRDGSTLELGMQCLTGKSPRRVRPFLFKFALSAVQSWLFNDYLSRRLRDGLLRTVLDGDVLMKWPFGGLFVSEDGVTDQERFNRRELVSGGPMFGKKTFPAKGIAAEREALVLQENGIASTAFDHFGKLMSGTRRHNLIYSDDLSSNWEDEGMRITFTLPSGCYATVLLQEVMKVESLSDEDSTPED